ncbi:MAG TPA: class I SAM-dependent methyltransferase [Opitutaceae bacterium]|nr:class I SAM-dependent methyltransferase [Opitutaceae bacterium]
MKVRDSGMPERDYWESLLDVQGILDALHIDKRLNSVVEVGCGYGTFTKPVAQRIGGTLHAFDIEQSMIDATSARLREARIQNVQLVLRDVIADGFDLGRATIDAVLLFNILHAENPVELLRASANLLTANGRIHVIHWRSDVVTPRGPDLAIRPRPEQVAWWAEQTGLLREPDPPVVLPPWHFGMSFTRTRF